MKEARIVIRGRVQGVGFRIYSKREADYLGVSGWVTNRSDGSVELLAQGGEKSILSLIEKLHKGPLLSCVRSLKFEWRSPESKLEGFRLKR